MERLSVEQLFKTGLSLEKKEGIWCVPESELTALAKEEAHYHDIFDEHAEDVHQLSSFRNTFYHRRIWEWLRGLPAGSRILEVGAGSGYDAAALIEDYALVLSDVSPETLRRLQRKTGWPVPFVALDGQQLPFTDDQFDGLYMVATWHHLEDPGAGLAEVARVVAPGGRIVFGVEPNKTYFLPLKWFRPLLIALARMRGAEVSHADEEMVGFSKREIQNYFATGEWCDVRIQPMWLFSGWLHYKIEFFYRMLGLKRRIRVPQFFEVVLVWIDELAFKIPGMSFFAWHWIITATKK